MRSSELAVLAGVTVRTLRHYHQLGLLAEPERSANGYRDYDARHLARVVRITRLACLGIPLADLPAVLDDPATAGALLDRLDRETAAEIDRLTTRRAQIAELRRHAVAADMPPALAFYPSALADAGVDPELARTEREHLALFAHLAGEAGTAALAPVYAALVEILPATADVNQRFLALGPDTPDGDVERLAEDIVALYGPVFTRLLDVPDVELPPPGPALLAEYADRVLNDRQRHFLELMGARWSELLDAPDPDRAPRDGDAGG